ncbi:MAG: B12-binding domain-containing protein [Pseudomonadota bacterium]
MTERLFTDEELKEMGRRTLDRLVDAIESGDSERAAKIAKRMYSEFLSMHDLYRNWITATLSTVGRKYGDEALEEIMNDGVDAWWGPISEKLPPGPENLKARVKMFAAGLQGHLQPMDIEEDDEKFTIRMKPCGSGGRLVQEGKYDGKDAFLTIKNAQPLTYGRKDFPVYCAHEYSMEKVDIERNGKPFVVVEPAHKIGKEHCRMIVYKNPDDVPAKYYERLGFKKPA